MELVGVAEMEAVVSAAEETAAAGGAAVEMAVVGGTVEAMRMSGGVAPEVATATAGVAGAAVVEMAREEAAEAGAMTV